MPKSPLQRAEWKILGLAISDARVRATRGQVAAGYACLIAGLRRMEEFVTGGEPWADAILEAYRREASRYRQNYPVPAEPDPDLVPPPESRPGAEPQASSVKH